jgi:hypothetical protein
LAAWCVLESVLDELKSQGKTHDLRLSVVSLASSDLSTGSEGGQESVILIFLDLLFGQSAASSLGGFGLLGGDLFKFRVSIARKSLEERVLRGAKLTCASVW